MKRPLACGFSFLVLVISIFYVLMRGKTPAIHERLRETVMRAFEMTGAVTVSSEVYIREEKLISDPMKKHPSVFSGELAAGIGERTRAAILPAAR